MDFFFIIVFVWGSFEAERWVGKESNLGFNQMEPGKDGGKEEIPFSLLPSLMTLPSFFCKSLSSETIA
jgi:hypothetical protein